MMFVVFVLIIVLLLRNIFYEDVDDYSWDFILKENVDYDEFVYDGYLFCCDLIVRNLGLNEFY